MTRPRSQLVSLDATPYYHCISRCVRRSFLCGKDSYTGKSFDHRKPWLVDRLALLANVFAIDIAAFAVMSNHYHLVVHIDKARAESWTDDQVIERWTTLFKGPSLAQQFKQGVPMTQAELDELQEAIQAMRAKLCSISKFMACMNEYLARRANSEDGCTGRFWEGRFKSQALLDETALLSCMAYVDLNPVRAGIARSVETSEFTSAQIRARQVRTRTTRTGKPSEKPPFKAPRLMPFREVLKQSDTFKAIPFTLRGYLDLVNWTGRAVRKDKKGYIPAGSPALLARLGISSRQWRLLALDIQKESITMLNGLDTLAAIERKSNKQAAA